MVRLWPDGQRDLRRHSVRAGTVGRFAADDRGVGRFRKPGRLLGRCLCARVPESVTPIPWLRLLPHRQTWAFAAGKFLTDPVWWFLLFWLPKFFTETYNLDLTGLAMPLVIIYLAADVGSIAGGWLSSALIKRGWSLNAARKTAMFACALCVVPVVAAPHFANLWVTVTLISLAAAGHQGWSANLFTLTSDMFPRRAVGSVTGIGGMAGAVGNLVVAVAVGYVLELTNSNYAPLLYVAGVAYLFALLVIHLLAPRLAPAGPGPAAAGFDVVRPPDAQG
jgi:ACS family hexuronate transporter-like MFS transporter